MVVLAPPGTWADTKASIACRAALGKLAVVAEDGFKLADVCHKTQDKVPASGAACNNVSNSAFDPTGKYAGIKAKVNPVIAAKCLAGDPVLNNYDGHDPTTVVEAEIDDAVAGNSALVEGIANLGGDKAKTKCLETVGKWRTKIVKEILKGSTKCQKGKDKTATTFGALDPSCVTSPSMSVPLATADIGAKCSGITGDQIGSCTPLPQCMFDAATQVGHDLAAAIYTKLTPPPTCGNGIIEGIEQCDDGANNGTPGDVCSTSCESLAETCGPGTPAGGSITGHRIATVSLNVPAGKQLAGVQVGFDYPQLEASIKGSGASNVVQTSFLVLATPGPDGFISLANDTDTDVQVAIASADDFIGTGPVLQVTLDQCVSLSQNICSRAQNVIGCCPTTDIDACNADPTNPSLCFCGAVGKINRSDCHSATVLSVTGGPCTFGLCDDPSAGGIPFAPAGSCDVTIPGAPGSCDAIVPGAAGSCDLGTLTCLSGNVGHACTPATEGTDCATGTNTCVAGSGNPGHACTTATEATDCKHTGTNKCTAVNVGHACKAATEADDCSAATTIVQSTCVHDEHCAYIGDQANGSFGCLSVFNPPGAKIGQFPPVLVGPPFSPPAPVGSCPTNNVCEKQASLMAASCTVTNPVDHLAQHVDGVTCSMTVTEGP